MPTIDWNDLMNTAGTAMEPVPIGEYDVELTKAEATSSSTGKPMWKVVFKITSGPHAGRNIWNNFTLSTENNNALGFFFAHMKALGLDRDFFARQPTPEQIAGALEGKHARIKVGHRPFQGVNRNDVKAIMPPLGAPNGATSSAVAPPPPPPPPAPAGVNVAAGGSDSGITGGGSVNVDARDEPDAGDDRVITPDVVNTSDVPVSSGPPAVPF